MVGLAVVEGVPAKEHGVRREYGTTRRPAAVWLGTLLALAGGVAAGLVSGSGTVLIVALIAVLALVVLVFLASRGAPAGLGGLPLAGLGSAGRHWAGSGLAWDDALLLVSAVLLLWSVLYLRRARLRPSPSSCRPSWPSWLPSARWWSGRCPAGGLRRPHPVSAAALLLHRLPLPQGPALGAVDRGHLHAGQCRLALHGLYQYVTGAPMPASWVDVREVDIATGRTPSSRNPNGSALSSDGGAHPLSLALARGLPAVQRGGHGGCVRGAVGRGCRHLQPGRLGGSGHRTGGVVDPLIPAPSGALGGRGWWCGLRLRLSSPIGWSLLSAPPTSRRA